MHHPTPEQFRQMKAASAAADPMSLANIDPKLVARLQKTADLALGTKTEGPLFKGKYIDTATAQVIHAMVQGYAKENPKPLPQGKEGNVEFVESIQRATGFADLKSLGLSKAEAASLKNIAGTKTGKLAEDFLKRAAGMHHPTPEQLEKLLPADGPFPPDQRKALLNLAEHYKGDLTGSEAALKKISGAQVIDGRYGEATDKALRTMLGTETKPGVLASYAKQQSQAKPVTPAAAASFAAPAVQSTPVPLAPLPQSSTRPVPLATLKQVALITPEAATPAPQVAATQTPPVAATPAAQPTKAMPAMDMSLVMPGLGL